MIAAFFHWLAVAPRFLEAMHCASNAADEEIAKAGRLYEAGQLNDPRIANARAGGMNHVLRMFIDAAK